MSASTKLVQGDCLEQLPLVDEQSVRLAYWDPPFFSQKVHRLRERSGGKEYSFSDLWSDQEQYAGFLVAGLEQMWRTLDLQGSVFLHCDRRATHVARAALDRVFGPSKFRAEIIWHYRRWSNARRALLPAHQTLFYYSKTDDYVFHPTYGDYSPATNVDQLLQRRVRDQSGKSVYERAEDGSVVSEGGKKGVPLSDVWDIPYLNPKARERVGYPTQKPLVLLERVVALTTNPGDTVLDPCCGSGTTLVAANLLGRNAIGIDVSEPAIELSRKRLAEPVRSGSRLLSKGRESYWKMSDDILAQLQGLDCIPVQRNAAVDALLRREPGQTPVPIRVQRTDESVADAAARLVSSSQAREAERLIVISSRPAQTGGPKLPDKVVVLSSLAAQWQNIE